MFLRSVIHAAQARSDNGSTDGKALVIVFRTFRVLRVVLAALWMVL